MRADDDIRLEGAPSEAAADERAAAAPEPSRAPRDLHDLPIPVTWDLFGSIRRRVQPPLAMTLVSIFDEAVCRTMLDGVSLEDVVGPAATPRDAGADAPDRHDGPDALPDGDLPGRATREFERRVREFARLRKEWVEVAREAVGDTGMTALRVEALALARAAMLASRLDRRTRGDLESVLCQLGPVLSVHGLARRERRTLDHARLRTLSSRIDFCVTAVLIGHADPCFAALRRHAPFLCAEALVAVTRLRSEVAGRLVS